MFRKFYLLSGLNNNMLELIVSLTEPFWGAYVAKKNLPKYDPPPEYDQKRLEEFGGNCWVTIGEDHVSGYGSTIFDSYFDLLEQASWTTRSVAMRINNYGKDPLPDIG